MKWLLPFTLLILVGCASTNPVTGEPHAARYVTVANYDSKIYLPTDSLQVYEPSDSIPTHHTIALLTISGRPNSEAKSMNAISWRARQLGAEGLQILTPIKPVISKWNPDNGVDFIFRANAVRFSP